MEAIIGEYICIYIYRRTTIGIHVPHSLLSTRQMRPGDRVSDFCKTVPLKGSS